MKQSRNSIIFSSIAVVTAMLIVFGFVFEKSEVEKINWLADAFDVSHTGDLAFIKYNMGIAEMYIKSEDEVQFIVSLSEEKEVVDLKYTPDGKAIVLSTASWESDDLDSEVSLFHLDTFEWEELFDVEALITELQFDPKDANKLYYLMARTFESYSPIAREYPHGFDIFHVDLATKEHFTHSDLQKYSMASLQVSKEKEALYVQMDDDFFAETADEIFESKQRVFELQFGSTDGFTVITDPEREVDVYDFALIPGEPAMVFQSVANYGAGGTFEYELYYYNWETKEEEQLTNLGSFADRPIISAEDNKVYFIVDDHFGKSNVPDWKIYSIDIDGDNLTEIELFDK